MSQTALDVLENLRRRVRALGIAKVARAARVPATTIYSFCQSSTQQLGYATAKQVEAAVIQLEAKHLAPSRQESAGTVYLPIVLQSAGYAAQFNDVGTPVKPVGTLPFSVDVYRVIAKAKKAALIGVTVSGHELLHTLVPGDVSVVDFSRPRRLPTADKPCLMRTGDRLLFARCHAAPGRRTTPVISFDIEPEPTLTINERQAISLIGEVKWFSRCLTA